MTSASITLDDARAYIERLDLNYIVDFMCSEAYPLPRWERPDALHCLTLYKNFLLLQKKHIQETLVPTRQIDEFWHNHILYTTRYFKDCLRIFGHYLHHEPVSPDHDHQKLIADYVLTKMRYLNEFGVPLELINQIACMD